MPAARPGDLGLPGERAGARRPRRLLERVHFCLLPMTNPDGSADGRSLTNGLGEAPKSSWQQAADGEDPPRETRTHWDYLQRRRPALDADIHAHFRWGRLWRTVGADVPDAVPESLRERARVVEAALRRAHPETEPEDGMSVIDVRQPDHRIYGNRHLHELGVLRVLLQGVPAGLDAHRADVQTFAETVAYALLEPSEAGRQPISANEIQHNANGC